MKKFGVPILVGLVIGGIASGGYLWWIRSKPTTVEQTATQIPTPVQFLTWTDPNGFTFQYPDGLSVNKHDEDTQNYAHIEFTHPDHPGSLIVWGKDPARGVVDAASWVRSEKRFTGASLVDTEFGSQAAKKVMVEGVTRTLVVGTVYDGITWYVETKLDDADFWTGVHTAIADSFAFVPVKEPGSATVSDVSGSPVGTDTAEPAFVAEDVAVDEEEVVE